jgi:hypothetical protein
MDDKFEKGKRYVFKAEKMVDDGFETVIEIKDLEVNVLSEGLGVVEGYAVKPEWCEEQSDIKAKMKKACDLMFETYKAMQELYELMEE